MKAKVYLKKIEWMDARINTRLEEIENLKALATKTTSVMEGDRVKASGSQQKMADAVNNIVDKMNEINSDIDRFINFKQEVLEVMDMYCDPNTIKLLYLKYFQYKTWEQVAVEMNFTYKWVSQGLHQRALAQVQKALDERGDK